ncbi:protein ABHD18-like [Oscarella lobularis]|uniref:protein ABHD18-like n=1 Tax=Oscarella lobularis TaxID=121494 RepID=UPI003313F71E
MSLTDRLYRQFIYTKFFTKGWGSSETLFRLLALRDALLQNPQQIAASKGSVNISESRSHDNYEVHTGNFQSPLAEFHPGFLPKESELAQFQMVLPKSWPSSNRKPICVQLAGTGDHRYWRRRKLLAKPLATENGIGSILLENPFYGVRKPLGQTRSALQHVSDLFVMGLGLALETAALFNWCLEQGYGPLGITGISMGGHMASISSTFWLKPIAIVPCLSWSTASVAFSQGVFKDACTWQVLEKDMEQASKIRDSGKIRSLSDPVLPSAAQGKGKPSLEALTFMLELMDTFTHLSSFPKPHPDSSIISVVAKDDEYMPRTRVTPLTEVWQNCEVRLVAGGHIQSYVVHHDSFQKAISDAFDRLPANATLHATN